MNPLQNSPAWLKKHITERIEFIRRIIADENADVPRSYYRILMRLEYALKLVDDGNDLDFWDAKNILDGVYGRKKPNSRFNGSGKDRLL